MFHLTIFTDFGIPSGRDFATIEQARAKGDDALLTLGCAFYRITQDGKTVLRVNRVCGKLEVVTGR